MTKTLYEFSNVSGNLLLIFWELVRKFDDLAEKLYEDFADDFNDYTESVIHIGFIGAGAREEVNFVVETSYPTGRPTDVTRPLDQESKNMKKDSPEEFIVSDKDIRMVLQLPINNKKKISRLSPFGYNFSSKCIVGSI